MSGYRSFAAGAAVAVLAATFVSPALARGPGADHGPGIESGGHGRGPDARPETAGPEAAAGARPEHSKGRGKDKVRPAATKMRFKLDQHHFDTGATVTATATLWSRAGTEWVPLSDASLRVLVDRVEVGLAVTDAAGVALIEWGGAADGGHVMKVVYDGDATHRKAQRAQGFHVGVQEEEEEEEEEIEEIVETLPLPEAPVV